MFNVAVALCFAAPFAASFTSTVKVSDVALLPGRPSRDLLARLDPFLIREPGDWKRKVTQVLLSIIDNSR